MPGFFIVCKISGKTKEKISIKKHICSPYNWIESESKHCMEIFYCNTNNIK